MPSRRQLLGASGALAVAGCLGARVDAARRRDAAAEAVRSSPASPGAVDVTDEHLASAEAAFDAARDRLEAEQGRPRDHGYGRDDPPPHSDADTRWEAVQSLRRASTRLETHVGRRRAQGGMSQRDVHERLDEAEAAVEPIGVEYAGGSFETCLVQTAVAESVLGSARRSLASARDRISGDGGLRALYGSYASALTAELHARDAAFLQDHLDGATDHADAIEALDEAMHERTDPVDFERHAGIRWWYVHGSTSTVLSGVIPWASEPGRIASAALSRTRARFHEAARRRFVDTVDGVPTTLEGTLEARDRAVTAIDRAPTDGPRARLLVGEAVAPVQRSDGRLRARATGRSGFYRGFDDEDYYRERAVQYLGAAALAERAGPFLDSL